MAKQFSKESGYSLTRGKLGEPELAPRWRGSGLAPSAPRGDSGITLPSRGATVTSASQVNVGDVLEIERDGRITEMNVDRIDPAGSYGTSELDGPHVHAQVRSGGYAMTFDDSHLRDGRVRATKRIHERPEAKQPKFAPAREDGAKPFVQSAYSFGKTMDSLVWASNAAEAKSAGYRRAYTSYTARRATPADVALLGE